MEIKTNPPHGAIGWIVFLIWLVFFALVVLAKLFSIPDMIMAIWLIVAVILMAVGV